MESRLISMPWRVVWLLKDQSKGSVEKAPLRPARTLSLIFNGLALVANVAQVHLSVVKKPTSSLSRGVSGLRRG